MLFSGKENIFMCLVAFQKMFRKIFSGAWLCSWKYHRKHIFYLLLTFSRLPNKYIISFIPQYKNTNKTQKKISSNPVKLREKGRERGAWVRQEARSRDAVLRSRLARRRDRDRHGASRDRDRAKRRRRQDRDRRGALQSRSRSTHPAIATGMVLREIVINASCDRDRRGASRDRDRRKGEITINGQSFSLYAYVSRSFSLFLPLHVCELLSLCVSVPEVI